MLARDNMTEQVGPRAVEIARWTLGYVAMGRGDTVGARAALEEALAFGLNTGEIGLILPPAWGLAEVALLAGEPDDALARCRDALARALAVGERVHLTPFVVTGVRAAQAAGRPAEGATWLAACRAHLESIPTVAGAALDHAQGLVALADGATGVARRALDRRSPAGIATPAPGRDRGLGSTSRPATCARTNSRMPWSSPPRSAISRRGWTARRWPTGPTTSCGWHGATSPTTSRGDR